MAEKLTKGEIKEAVNESLLEALNAAEEKQRQDAFSPRAILQAITQIIQVILIPILGYLLLQVVQLQKDIVGIQKDIAVLRVDVKEVNDHILDHTSQTTEKAASNAILHHSKLVTNAPCTGCHDASKIRPQRIQ